jgi:predicted aspartyl protease
MNKLSGSLVLFPILFGLLCGRGFCQSEIMEKFASGRPIYATNESIIPFSLEGHRIIVKVRINDSNTEYSFMLDTGALTIIDQEAADELKLKKGTAMPTMKQGENAFLTRVDRISLGEMGVEDFEIPIMDIPRQFDRRVMSDGFIGSDFLRFFRTTIDYENRNIILRRDTNPALQGKGIRIKVDIPFPMRFPTLSLTTDSLLEINGIIDTGSPYELVLPMSFLEMLPANSKSSLIRSKGILAKWPGTSLDYNYLWRIKKLKCGELEIKDLPVLFAELPLNFTASGLIGKKLLEHYLLTIDYPGQELILVPNGTGDPQSNIFSCGVGLKKGTDGRTIVQGFWEGSPADRASLAVGTEIVEINDKTTSDLSLAQINYILEDDRVKTIKFLIRAEGRNKKVELAKEKIFKE